MSIVKYPCAYYYGGECDCRQCISAEHSFQIDRKKFKVLESKDYPEPDIWAKNDHRAGAGEIKEGSPIQIQNLNIKSPKQIFRLEVHHIDGDNYWCIISCDTNKNLVWEIENNSVENWKKTQWCK